MRLYTTEEVAEILGIAVTTLRYHCQKGHIGRKVGGSWIFTEEDIVQFRRTRRGRGQPRKLKK